MHATEGKHTFDSAQAVLGALRNAARANDPESWHDARQRLTEKLSQAKMARGSTASPSGNDPIRELETAFEVEVAAGAPRGFSSVRGEAELEAILVAPILGTARDGYDDKERQLGAAMAGLDPSDSRILVSRLRSPRPNDVLATRFGQLAAERRARLLEFLDGARRRAALERRGAQPLPESLRGDLERATGTGLIDVRVHADEHGDGVAKRHGAHGVAIGDDIYLAAGRFDPDGTAGQALLAHETAHVVQSRVPAGDASAAHQGGDVSAAAEGEADAFADDFVARRGAARFRPRVGVALGTAMRRDAAEPPKPVTRDEVSITTYLERWFSTIVAAIVDHQLARPLDPGDPQLRFPLGPVTFVLDLFSPLVAFGASHLAFDRWMAPVKLAELVERSRPIYGRDDQTLVPLGPNKWAPEVGTAVASAVATALDLSLKRIGPRVVAATAMQRAQVSNHKLSYSDIVASSPLDSEVIKTILGRHGTPTIVASDGALKPSIAARRVRPITHVEWQGAHGGPWNGVRVEPVDASIEDVAQHLLTTSRESYRLRQVGDVFLVPAEVAATIPAAVAARRSDASSPEDEIAFGPNSAAAISAEVARSTQTSARLPDGNRSWADVDLQLRAIELMVKPLGFADQLARAHTFHATRKLDAAEHRTELGAQSELLAEINSDLAQLLDALGHQASTKGTPAHVTIAVLVRAAAHAHLVETSRQMLAETRETRRQQVLNTLQHDLGSATTQIALEHSHGDRSAGDAEVSRRALGQDHDQRAQALARRIAALRETATLDPEAVASLAHDISNLQLDAQLVADIGAIGEVARTVHELKQDKATMFGAMLESLGGYGEERLQMLEGASNNVRSNLQRLHSRLTATQKKLAALTAAYVSAGVNDASGAARAFAAAELAAIRRDVAELYADDHINVFLGEAKSMIKDIGTRTALLKLEAFAGVMAVSMGVGAVAEGAVAGAVGAGTASALAGTVAETLSFTVLDAELRGEPILHAFVSNFAGNLITMGGIRVAKRATAGSWIGKTLETSGSARAASKTMFAAAKLADLTVSSLVIAGVQFGQAEVESAIANGRAMTMAELKAAGVHGIAMMIGSAFMHHAFAAELDSVKGKVAGFIGNIKTARELSALSARVAEVGNGEQTLQLLSDARHRFEAEAAAWEQLHPLPDNELVARGLSRAAVDAMGTNSRGGLQRVKAIETPAVVIQLSLDAITPGRVYAGSHASVKAVLERCNERGWRYEKVADGYTIRSGDLPIHVLERADDAAATTTRDIASSRDDREEQTARSSATSRSAAGSTSIHAADLAHLGARIAGRVEGASYSDGQFHIRRTQTDLVVSIRRTDGPQRILHGEHQATLEIPKGLSDAALESVLVGQLTELRSFEIPQRTPYGDVWPGDVPDFLPPRLQPIFEAAAAVYKPLSKDGYQGAQSARIHWAKYLFDHGVAIEGIRYAPASHEIYEISAPRRTIRDHDASVVMSDDIGTRSPNTAQPSFGTCLRALEDLAIHSALLKGATIHGRAMTIPLPGGRSWSIRLALPQPTGDRMAALRREADADVVWVSDKITDEHVPRALGAIIGESLDGARHSRGNAAWGELDAMLARRDAVAERPASPPLPDNADHRAIIAHAEIESRQESIERIDAEIDLALTRLSLTSKSDPRLADLAPELASKIRARLDGALMFHAASALTDAHVAKPTPPTTTPRTRSSILPDGPTRTHAYTAADRIKVVELRSELAILKEIDMRVSNRDRPGTNGGANIAKGEMTRRQGHVARARELLYDLQLGGTDASYNEARLAELAAVFPGVERDIVPAVRERIRRRDSREHMARLGDEARAKMAARSKQLAEQVHAQTANGAPFMTKRVVVGAGLSGLADVASLRVAKSGAWLDPHEVLVIGNDDVIARINPDELWGQRAVVYDRPDDAHPAFADADGHGTGLLVAAVEDPGNFMRVGEFRDAADVARERLGIAPLRGVATSVETTADRANGGPVWHANASGSHTRTHVELQEPSAQAYIYADDADIANGVGKARQPHPAILSEQERTKLAPIDNDERILINGIDLLAGTDVRGKRVCVMAFGPTGAWAAVFAARHGAARVDWSGAAGGELGTGILRRRGQDDREVVANDMTMRDTSAIDRVQDALDPSSGVHTTFDRIIQIQRKASGGVITYSHGPGENAELYHVEYDVIVGSMGFDQNTKDSSVVGEPTTKDLIGEMKMTPHRSSKAPVLEDAKTGHVRVVGYAAGDATNLTEDRAGGNARREFSDRRDRVKNRTSSDSPDDRVVEGIGISTRVANLRRQGPVTP